MMAEMYGAFPVNALNREARAGGGAWPVLLTGFQQEAGEVAHTSEDR